jgi:hypothetical protein
MKAIFVGALIFLLTVCAAVADNAKSENKSTYDKITEQMAADVSSKQIADILKAYQSGAMSPEARAEFESNVKAGKIMLPVGVTIGISVQHIDSAVELPKGVIDAYNVSAADPYNTNLMPTDARKELDMDLKNGKVKLPSGNVLNQTYPSFADNLKASIAGSKRATDAMMDALRNVGEYILLFVLCLIVMLVGLAVLAGCAYFIWKIVSNILLYLRNTQLRMKLEQRELEARSAEQITQSNQSNSTT